MNETLHYLLMVNHLAFQKALLVGIRDTNLTLGQPKILDYLRDHDGAVQKEIAAACYIEPATLTSILLGMENKNLIVRRMHGNNRRSLYVYLTGQGKELAKQVESEFCRIEECALREFSDEERALLNDFLIRIKDNLEKKEDL